MRCPSLIELPPPPPGKAGWPWTVESQQLPDATPEGKPWPRVSIVTPSYNQGQFIEETIRSVLLQGYPDLEYIVIDGGSADSSLDIIRKYEPWLSYWVSEPDHGQSQAINKGWRQATGEILAWLNSDDTYEPRAVWKAVEFLQSYSQVDMVYGDCFLIDRDSQRIMPFWNQESLFKVNRMIQDHRWCIPQQTVFIRKSILEQVEALDESLNHKMDRDLYIRIGLKGRVVKIKEHLANFRVHGNAKSHLRNNIKAWQEFRLIRKRYGGRNSISSNYYFWKQFLRKSVINTISRLPVLSAAVLYFYGLLRRD